MMKPSIDQEHFKQCIEGAVISIDITNSTRMSDEERRELADRIIVDLGFSSPEESAQAVLEELKERLMVPFDPDSGDPHNGKNHLFAILVKETSIGRMNISFASKFCSYGYGYLIGGENPYSRYDNVVSGFLSSYMDVYGYPGDKKPRKNSYKISQCKQERNDPYKYRLDVYRNYCFVIGYIIDSLKKEGIILTRDEFDHIIWYSQK